MRRSRCDNSELFDPGSKIQLLRPGAPVLSMQMPIALGDGRRKKCRVRLIGSGGEKSGLADAAINDSVRDVDAPRPKLTR